MGIEPTLSAWKAGVLPLNYARSGVGPAPGDGRRSGRARGPGSEDRNGARTSSRPGGRDGVWAGRGARGWWGEQDSNLRRRGHQIYSLTPLTARESPLVHGPGARAFAGSGAHSRAGVGAPPSAARRIGTQPCDPRDPCRISPAGSRNSGSRPCSRDSGGGRLPRRAGALEPIRPVSGPSARIASPRRPGPRRPAEAGSHDPWGSSGGSARPFSGSGAAGAHRSRSIQDVSHFHGADWSAAAPSPETPGRRAPIQRVQARSLPAPPAGASGGTRTHNRLITNQELCQLSHAGLGEPGRLGPRPVADGTPGPGEASAR